MSTAIQNLYDISSVENLIFEFLLPCKNDKYDFPTIQIDAVEKITNNLSDFIYDNLKQKSSASSIRRGNVLKFINILCQEKEAHAGSEDYKCFFKNIDVFKANKNENLNDFFVSCSKELESLSLNDFTKTVVDFYKLKNCKQKEKHRCLESIKKYEEENLSVSSGVHTNKHISCYQTSENLIIEMLGSDTQFPTYSDKFCMENETEEYRKKQIKLCYALINLNSELNIIKRIVLFELSKYESLLKFEVNFLNYLWTLESEEFSDFGLIIAEKFYFIIEICIIELCTEIIAIQEDEEACAYFTKLEDNIKVKKLRDLHKKSSIFYRKHKSLIHDLFEMSFCNSNLLKFCDMI